MTLCNAYGWLTSLYVHCSESIHGIEYHFNSRMTFQENAKPELIYHMFTKQRQMYCLTYHIKPFRTRVYKTMLSRHVNCACALIKQIEIPMQHYSRSY